MSKLRELLNEQKDINSLATLAENSNAIKTLLFNAAPEIADLLDACKAVQECAIDDEYTPRMWKARDELDKKLGGGE